MGQKDQGLSTFKQFEEIQDVVARQCEPVTLIATFI